MTDQIRIRLHRKERLFEDVELPAAVRPAKPRPEARVVASPILKTKTQDAGDDPDAKVLIDADLAILVGRAGQKRFAVHGVGRDRKVAAHA